ncbi:MULTISPECIES: hypothetical protein [Cupriavidus]
MVTLVDLHARMSTSPAWWRAVPGVCVGKVRALLRFVEAHAQMLTPFANARIPWVTCASRSRSALGSAVH